MTRIAATKTTKDEKVRDAKRAFLLGLIDISWKLAGAFLVPVAIGLLADSRQEDSKTYTTAGIFVGFLMAFLVIIQLARSAGEDR